MKNQFVDVLLPLALAKPLTYSIPQGLEGSIQFGVRCEVQMGKNKLYSGIVVDLHNNKPIAYKTKEILSQIDQTPIITQLQWQFWQWMAEYYCCTPGEVMNAALPAHLKLASETKLLLNISFSNQLPELSDKEYLICEALQIRNTISIDDARSILDQKNVYPVINKLIERGLIFSEEEIKTKYKAQKSNFVGLREPYRSDTDTLKYAFEKIQNSAKQTEALLAFWQMARGQTFVKLPELIKESNVSREAINALVKKGIFEVVEREISRISSDENFESGEINLNTQQEAALKKLQLDFNTYDVALIFGVTGSGKTLIYTEFIKEILKEEGQVLFLLPEIALTGQIVERLKKLLGREVIVYHSRLSNQERVEVWNAVLTGKGVILSARSGIFLPFTNLKCIVIDEEHDPSYKQNDPSPRYQGRDAAIFLAKLHGAKTILGSATPSVETYKNAVDKKYACIKLNERFGGILMPEFLIVDLTAESKKRKLQAHFSEKLIEILTENLYNKKQAILFQNRRGYAPIIECPNCDWSMECPNCDVHLTFHKFSKTMRCHYCGYSTKLPEECPACGHPSLEVKGIGTERIEDEISNYLPDAKISRLDMDVARKKDGIQKILTDFEDQKIDILVGTQMITKGLDFDHIGVVGIINFDQLYRFPDFRCQERAFQLVTQVAGRAGRKNDQGKVVLQTYHPGHPLLKKIIEYDFEGFFETEIEERQKFFYPPFCKIIHITIRHKDYGVADKSAKYLTTKLTSKFGNRIKGPVEPPIARVRNLFIREVWIKLERKQELIKSVKTDLLKLIFETQSQTGWSNVRFSIDVDP